MQSNENRELVLLWNLNQPINVYNMYVIPKFFRSITNVNEFKSLAGFYML